MILMASDYVGYHIVNYLCEIKEAIDIFVYDASDRGGYNMAMIDLIKGMSPVTKIYESEDLKNRDVLSDIKMRQIDLGILAWWPHIVSDQIIKLTDRGFINTHPGYLPYTRGKHGSFWSIVEGSPFGVTLHYVDVNIDSGPIIVQREIPVTWSDTGETLYKRAREQILELFYENYKAIKDGSIKACPQIGTSGTFHLGRELDAICMIDLDKEYTARTLLNIIRAKMFEGQGTAYFVDGTSKYNVTISVEKVIE